MKVVALLRGWGIPTLLGELSVTIFIFPPDRRKRDIDNIAKATLDALTIAGLWKDDSQIKELNLEMCETYGKLIVVTHPYLKRENYYTTVLEALYGTGENVYR
jgi:hypothetical protein